MHAARKPGSSPGQAVRVEARDRKRLEQLCRHTTRPALSDRRVQLNDAGQVELKLKTPWRDGTTHLVMSPLEFMQRLIRLHSALAPNAKLLKRVFPLLGGRRGGAAPHVGATPEDSGSTVVHQGRPSP